jgi:hypothetical protein
LQEGPIVYGVQKIKWNPLLEASVALKIGKNELKCEKITTLQNRWG